MAKKPLSEKETRKRLRGHAINNGNVGEFDKLIAYWDNLIANAKTTVEYRMLQVAAVDAMDRFFGVKCQYLLDNMTPEDYMKERNDDKEIIKK